MEKTWENIRDEITKTYEIISIDREGKLLRMADAEYTFNKSWIYYRDYQAEQWVEIYSAIDDYISIDEILKSQENISPDEGLEPLDDTIKAGFILVSDTNVHKIVTKLKDCDVKSFIFTLTIFTEAADQELGEEAEEESQLRKTDVIYTLRIYSNWGFSKSQYDNIIAEVKSRFFKECYNIVFPPYKDDLPDGEYEQWLMEMIKRKETSEEEYINFCRSHGLGETIHPPDLKAAKLFYYTNMPRSIADLALTDEEQNVRVVFPRIVEFVRNNGLYLYDNKAKADIDLDHAEQLPPGWINYWESLKKPK
jgi:hypothetical protein